jgi:hypothetical protein
VAWILLRKWGESDWIRSPTRNLSFVFGSASENPSFDCQSYSGLIVYSYDPGSICGARCTMKNNFKLLIFDYTVQPVIWRRCGPNNKDLGIWHWTCKSNAHPTSSLIDVWAYVLFIKVQPWLHETSFLIGSKGNSNPTAQTFKQVKRLVVKLPAAVPFITESGKDHKDNRDVQIEHTNNALGIAGTIERDGDIDLWSWQHADASPLRYHPDTRLQYEGLGLI